MPLEPPPAIEGSDPSDSFSKVKGSWFYTLIALQVVAGLLQIASVALITLTRLQSNLPIVDDIPYIAFCLSGLSSLWIGIMILCFRKKLLVCLYVTIEIAFFVLFFVLFYKLVMQAEITEIRENGSLNEMVWGFIAAVFGRVIIFTVQMIVMMFRLKRW